MAIPIDPKLKQKSGKTPNGSDWPMNYRDHTQQQMDYAWRSPGSYMPPNLDKGVRHAAHSPFADLNRKDDLKEDV